MDYSRFRVDLINCLTMTDILAICVSLVRIARILTRGCEIKMRCNISKTSARVSSEVPMTEKQMKDKICSDTFFLLMSSPKERTIMQRCNLAVFGNIASTCMINCFGVVGV